MLVDFKGGATFAALDRLPHTSAVITNLADELSAGRPHARRARTARWSAGRSCCAAAGNYASPRDYERARAAGAPLAPAAEPARRRATSSASCWRAKPDFIDLFVQIGRLGRSLGVHLLLASQRLEEGRLRGLDTHLSYRIGLRTFSAMESRVVLGVPDAYELPRAPGPRLPARPAPTALIRFRAAYVSGRVPGRARRRRPAGGGRLIDPVATYGTGYVAAGDRRRPASRAGARADEHAGGRRLLDVLVDRLRRARAAGPPGLAAAAGRAADAWTSCCRRSRSTPTAA